MGTGAVSDSRGRNVLGRGWSTRCTLRSPACMYRANNCYGNPFMESCIGGFKTEHLSQGSYGVIWIYGCAFLNSFKAASLVRCTSKQRCVKFFNSPSNCRPASVIPMPRITSTLSDFNSTSSLIPSSVIEVCSNVS